MTTHKLRFEGKLIGIIEQTFRAFAQFNKFYQIHGNKYNNHKLTTNANSMP